MPAKVSIYEKQLTREIRGTPEEYLPNLLQIVRLFRESVTLKAARAIFRQGWNKALAGKTRAVPGMWEGAQAQLKTPERFECAVRVRAGARWGEHRSPA